MSAMLTAEIPECMSQVIGSWGITVQDAMPDEMRNGQRWKSLVARAAGTGREREQERLSLILDWMWGTVLPSLQALGDDEGIGQEWARMATERTFDAAATAAEAAQLAVKLFLNAGVKDGRLAEAALAAAEAAWAAEWAKTAKAAARAGVVAWVAAEIAEAAWDQYDPCALLERLIAVGEKE